MDSVTLVSEGISNFKSKIDGKHFFTIGISDAGFGV